MIKSQKLLVVIFFVLSISSCEYVSDDVYIQKVNPPPLEHQFDLSLLSCSDTIKLFNRTQFSFNFNTYGLKIKQGVFTLYDKSWNIYSTNDNFTISPEDYTPGIAQLSLVLYTNSGSGSIADLAGAEGYQVNKTWTIIIDGREAPRIIPVKSISNDGYLKISWPKCDQFNFNYYQLSVNYGNSISYERILRHADSCFIIDTSFFGGDLYFSLQTNVFTDNQNSSNVGINIFDSVPKLNFEDIGIDSLKIFWKKSKYKCKYTLSKLSPDSVLLISTKDTVFKMATPGFGESAEFGLITSSYYDIPNDYSYLYSDYEYYTLGQHIAPNWLKYGYNSIQKTLYTNTYDNIDNYDVISMQKKSSLNIYRLMYQGQYSCPTNSTNIAALSSENIHIFPDNSFTNPTIIPYNCLGSDVDHFYITDNNLIAIASPNKYELISIAQQKIIATINITDYPIYSKWACISTSKDGKYACFVTYNGLVLNYIENGNVSQIYTDDRSYSSVLFNINDPSQLFLTMQNSNSMEIRNANNFNLVKTITLPTNSEVLRNIDPESGYLLLTDYTYLYILDLINEKIALKVKSSDPITQLYGNKLFSFSAHYLDISKYLKK